MGWGAAFGAALGIGGGVASAFMNAKEAKKNREWQEKMSNTAYRRQVNDLRKAGINPILASRLGGASTPGGGIARMPDLGQAASSGARAGTAASLAKTQKAHIGAQTIAANEQAKNTAANTLQTGAQTQQILSEQPRRNAEAKYYSTPEGEAAAARRIRRESYGPNPITSGVLEKLENPWPSVVSGARAVKATQEEFGQAGRDLLDWGRNAWEGSTAKKWWERIKKDFSSEKKQPGYRRQPTSKRRPRRK